LIRGDYQLACVPDNRAVDRQASKTRVCPVAGYAALAESVFNSADKLVELLLGTSRFQLLMRKHASNLPNGMAPASIVAGSDTSVVGATL
jgi:hypothetical protein